MIVRPHVLGRTLRQQEQATEDSCADCGEHKAETVMDGLGSSSIKDLHLVTNLLPPATSPYLVRTKLSVNELLEGNAFCPNYNNGVREREGRVLANVTAGSTLQDLQGAPGNWAMEDLAIQPEGRQT